MWALILNGERLDLLSSWQPSMSRKNNAFAFGAMELSRTQSFTLPSTPTNDAAFAVGRDYHNNGTQMRRYHEAWLLGDSASYHGDLYVDDADKTGYRCVFVFGDLAALKALSDVKKIDYDTCGVDAQLHPIRNGISRSLNYAVATNSTESLGNTFVNRLYTNRTTPLSAAYHYPSVKVADLFANVESLYGIRVALPTEAADLAVVLEKLNGQTNAEVAIAKTGLNAASVTTNEMIKVSTLHTTITWVFQGSQRTPIPFKWFECVQDCEVVFPSDFPDDVFLCDGQLVPTFYGGYSFDTRANISTRANFGKPLAGRKVKLTKNDENGNILRYGFFKKGNYQNQGSGSTLAQGFSSGSDASAYSYTLTATSTEAFDPTEERNYYLRDNYPAVGYMDLLKTIATISGKWMYMDGGTIRFADYAVGSWEVKELNKVMSIVGVQRRFADFGQRGVFAYDSASSVTDKQTASYEVDNETLSAEKSIYKIPFSEGGGTNANADSLFVDDFYKDTDGTLKWESDKQHISLIGTDTNLARTSIADIPALSQLCEKSTAAEATIAMTAYEFSRLREDNTLLIGSSLWVWLAATWSKGTAKISLQKWE